ncbi:hypothetical protein C8J57DRAFT_1464252 [Mycena rebaudengoi]|nr:hypothetical protein C8J57DRAFT_1464252 [Mycena rebaudengoi]
MPTGHWTLLPGITHPDLLGVAQIALSTPRLWRAIKLCPPTMSPTKALDLLRAWVSRSKDCPLSISLQCSTWQLKVDFIQAIIPHSERWEHIDFMLPIRSLQLIGADFPLLRSLTLGPTCYAEKFDSLYAISLFSNAPLLKQVTLSGNFGPFEIQLPWSQLTSISVNWLSPAEYTQILQHSAALREFCCDALRGGARRNVMPMVPLRHLHSLKFGGGFSLQKLLEVFITPALQHLTVSERLFDPIPHVNALILRSHCTLASLHILHTKKVDATYRAAFPSIPTITVTSGGL